MDARRSLLWNSRIRLVLVVVALAAGNQLAQSWWARADLTAQKEHTLSPAARAIVSSLDAPVKVEVFQSADLPPELLPHVQRVHDLLAEYRRHATAPFDVHISDPSADPEVRERAQRLGVQAEVVTVRQKGKQQKQDTFLGLTFLHRDQQEVLPFVRDVSTLEYDIARALRSMQQGGRKKVVAFATGHGEPDVAAAQAEQRHPLFGLAAGLARDYELRAIDLAAEGEVATDVDALILLGPRESLGERGFWAVDQHVMRGRALAIFPLPAVPNLAEMRLEPAPVSWKSLLGPWGVRIGEQLVLDRAWNGVIRVPVRRNTQFGVLQGQAPVNSPLVPMVRDLAKDHPITERMQTIAAPFAVAVEAAPAGAKVMVLASSTAESVLGVDVQSLQPEAVAAPKDGEQPGPFPVLVAMEGRFPSGWKGQLPPEQGGEAAARKALARAQSGTTEEEDVGPAESIAESPDATRVVVSGSFELALANPGLLPATIDWLVGDEQLLAIRPRAASPAPMPAIEVAQATALRAVNVFGGPLILVLIGAWRARARRRRAVEVR